MLPTLAIGAKWLSNSGLTRGFQTGNSTVDSALNWFDNGTRGVTSRGIGSTPTNIGVINNNKTTPNKTPVADNSQWDSMKAQIQALTNQLSQQPKLPDFDILGNYNKAKKTATAAVTPLYNKKLNLFLAGQGIKKDEKTKNTALGKENANIGLQTTLEDNSTSRVRTGEDLANALAAIGTGRENFLTDDAQQFDLARRALMEETAAGGAIDTGLGQQTIGQQQDDRNIQSARQLTEMKNQEAAKQLFANRTIDDLATADTRAGQKKGQEVKALDIDFDSYMASLANEESSFRLQNELDKAFDIAGQTSTYAQQGTQQFLAGLAGKGYRAQDIALANQVYR